MTRNKGNRLARYVSSCSSVGSATATGSYTNVIGAGGRARTCTGLRLEDFKPFACGGLERDYRHTSYKRRNLDGVFLELVLSLIDDG